VSRPLHPSYRFATEAQWQTCQFVGADRRTAKARNGLTPFAPYGLPPKMSWEGASYAPAINEVSDLLWRDTAGFLRRLPYGEEAAHEIPAPGAIASAVRMVAVAGTLWVLDAAGHVEVFDDRTFARLFSPDLRARKATDLASDGLDGVHVLVSTKGSAEILHLGCAGGLHGTISVPNIAEAEFVTFLAQSGTLVLLGSERSKILFVKAEDGRIDRVVRLSALRSCFDALALGSDGCSRLLVAGRDGEARGGDHQVLLLDAEGDLLGKIPVADAITGIAADRSQLVLTTEKAVLRLEPASAVPVGVGEVSAVVLTPLLQSAAKEAQQWTRIEARVDLRPGCSIEISYATAPDNDARARALAILEDRSMSPAQRLGEWHRSIDLHTVTYHGEPGHEAGSDIVLSAPLHDVVDPFIWVQVTLNAAAGGRIPVLSELSVLYPGPTLIEHLPAIYRSGELEPGDVTRGLVGVLEASTQGLDQKISELGRNIDPSTAPGAWLNYVAGWVGLPWDNALSTEQKRRILSRASELSAGYSTRAGLEAFLECIIPGRPRRFRVSDSTAQYGLATLGGDSSDGSRLPAVLAGLPRTMAAIGSNSVLGKARLTCPETPESAHLLGRVRVDIAASAEERGAWEPWLQRLIETLIPATVRVVIRWLPQNSLRIDRIDGDSRLEDQPAALLGSAAVAGAARLGGRARTTLPGRLTRNSTLQ
jgi:phage tail-like protein